MMKTTYFCVALATLVFGAAACGDDGEGELSAAADACEHMQEGPNQTVTALADSTGTAPAIGEEHTRFDIALVGDTGMLGGYVELAVDEAGEFTLFMNADVKVVVTDANDAEVAAEATNSNVTECTEVSIGHTFDFEVGSYLLQFGPSSESQVQIVVVHEGEHMHE